MIVSTEREIIHLLPRHSIAWHQNVSVAGVVGKSDGIRKPASELISDSVVVKDVEPVLARDITTPLEILSPCVRLFYREVKLKTREVNVYDVAVSANGGSTARPYQYVAKAAASEASMTLETGCRVAGLLAVPHLNSSRVKTSTRRWSFSLSLPP